MEVTLFVPQGDAAGDFLLGAEARFGTMTIYTPDADQHVEFGVSSATLRLVLSGCKILQGDRLGDQLPKPKTTHVQLQKVTTKGSTYRRKLGVSGEVGAKPSGAVAKVGASGQLAHETHEQVEERETRKTDFEISNAPIVPLSNNRWLFQSVNGKALMARQAGDEHLCKIAVTSETVTITAQFYFYPKHIVLFEGELAGGVPLFKGLKESRTKAAIAKTLLKRQLAEQSGALDSLGGAVMGCIFRLKNEADEAE